MLCMRHDQAASLSDAIDEGHTVDDLGNSLTHPFNALQVFCAAIASLKTIVKHARRLPAPFVLRVRSRTVANVDSTGFVVRM